MSAIVGDYGEGCRSDVGFANPGDRYIELASQTEGISESIATNSATPYEASDGIGSQFAI